MVGLVALSEEGVWGFLGVELGVDPRNREDGGGIIEGVPDRGVIGRTAGARDMMGEYLHDLEIC